MFTYRTTNILFIILLTILCLLWLTGFQISIWYPIILAGAYLAVSVGFSFIISSNYHVKSYSKGDTQERLVSITFDDGPDVEFTHRILDVLMEKRGPATFFLIGRKIQGNEPLISRMVSEGHILGMHSFSHSRWFDLYSSKRMKNELLRTEEHLKGIIGRKPLYFRPPYGVTNPMVKNALKGTGYHVIGFSNRAWDTMAAKENKVLSRITRKIRPGEIILLHDTIQQNINVLKRLLEHLQMENYKVVPLDQLLKLEPYV
jgi:peptidoglycan-N-acetylglucosamine deacetylase